jgi:predicted metal-dependent peptidase
MKQPLFASHLLKNCRIEYNPTSKLCHTNGETVTLNDWFCGLTLDQRVFVLAHETCHDLFGHPQRGVMYKRRGFGPDMKPYDHRRMAKAADYYINSLLIQSGIGKMPPGGLYDQSYGCDLTMDQIYEKLAEDPEQGPSETPQGPGEDQGEDGEPQPGDTPDSGNFDSHGDPEDQPGQPQTEQEINDQVQQNVKLAQQAAEAAGDGLTGALAKLVGDIVEPKVQWDEELRQFCTSVPRGTETTWSRINRRRLCSPPYLPYPGKDGHEIDCMAIAVDASGSIGPDELAMFMAEMRSIMETVRPRECWVLWWDTEVSPVEIIDPEDLESLTPYGGGGTNYTCVPAWLDQQGMDPDVVVCLTDGWVHWPDADKIRWPHVTVSTSQHGAPFGHTIYMHN